MENAIALTAESYFLFYIHPFIDIEKYYRAVRGPFGERNAPIGNL